MLDWKNHADQIFHFQKVSDADFRDDSASSFSLCGERTRNHQPVLGICAV
jgi:hypothetical protein